MLELGKEALEANLSRLDDWQAQFEEDVERAIQELKDIKKSMFDKLFLLRCDLEDEITRTLAEAAESLEQDLPIGLSPLACELRRFSADSSDRFSLFDSTLTSQQQRIDSYYKWKTTNRDSTLVVVQPDTVYFFDPSSKQWSPQIQPLSRRICANVHSSIALLSNSEVLICGGDPSAQIFIINTQDGKVKPAGALGVARNDPALVWVPVLGEAYLFGGLGLQAEDEPLKLISESEALVPEMQSTRPLPDLSTPRGIFNPCLCSNRVYLCGGGPTTVEIFNLATQCFEGSVDMMLPAGSAWSCAAVQQDDWLIVLTNLHIWRWNVSTGEKSKAVHLSYQARSICPPVLNSGYIYLLTANEDEEEFPLCLAVDISSGNIAKAFPPSVNANK